MKKCECGVELDSNYKTYCKKCASKRNKLAQQAYRAKMKIEYENRIKERKNNYCCSVDTKEKIIVSFKENKHDLTIIASVSDLLDIQAIIKKCFKLKKDFTEIYNKYDKKYNHKYIEKYIERCIS